MFICLILIEGSAVIAYPRSMSMSYHSSVISSTKAISHTDLQSSLSNTTSENMKKRMISYEVATNELLPVQNEKPTILPEKKYVRKRHEAKRIRYELVKVALLKFKELNGDIKVPQNFVIPKESNVWPEGTLGMNLGSIVHSIRGLKRYVDRRKELESIGFSFDPQRAKYGYNLVKAALLLYKEKSKRGDMHVPYNYIVEENEMWPKAMWGMKLGQIVNNIRGGNYADRKIDLQNIGFSFDAYNSKYHLVKLALLKFKELNGDMLVPRRFIVPKSEDWPKETWDLKLGGNVYNIRGGTSFSDCREDLISIGFRFDSLQAKYEIMRVSLLKYKDLYGNMLVPKGFEVPINSTDWPVELWGMKLGKKVHNVRGAKGCFSDKKDDLLSIGFVYVVRKKFDYECVKIAFFKYRELHHGHIEIPAIYNIPQNDSWYPEETWGMCLGSCINRIKKGEKWPQHRKSLLGPHEYGRKYD